MPLSSKNTLRFSSLFEILEILGLDDTAKGLVRVSVLYLRFLTQSYIFTQNRKNMFQFSIWDFFHLGGDSMAVVVKSFSSLFEIYRDHAKETHKIGDISFSSLFEIYSKRA